MLDCIFFKLLLNTHQIFCQLNFIYKILDYKSLQFKQLINDITIDIQSFGNFASIEHIRRKCNSMVDLSKFTYNKNILSEVVALSYNKVCSQTLSCFHYNK